MDELESIATLLKQCLTVTSQASTATAAHSNLANVEWYRGCLLWKMKRTDEAVRTVEHALYEDELAQKYQDATQESFIAGAEIVCQLLEFQAGKDSAANAAQADLKWPMIYEWLEDAVYAGWSHPTSLTQLLQYCPALKYLNSLGPQFEQKLTQFCDER